MENEEIKSCYLCKCRVFNRRPGRVRDNKAISILECANCGLVQLSSRHGIKSGFYENSGMHGDELINIRSWLEIAKPDDLRRYEYLKREIKGKKVLDFGCGAGGFITLAQKMAGEIYGIEPEKRLIGYFAENGMKVFASLKCVRNKKFDFITLFHVLEHLPDPGKCLQKLGSLLKKGGRIIVEVPNSNDALLTLFNNRPFSNFTYWSCHLYLFNEETLSFLFKRSGFEVVYIKQIQRYAVSNHMYWLAKGKPGGHEKWRFLNSKALNRGYEKVLGQLGACDTIICSILKP